MRDEAGRIVRVEGAFQDISAQHQAEMQAQRNAQHHAELLQVQQQISSLDMALPDALRLVAHTCKTDGRARAMIELLEAEQLVAKASVGDMVRPEGNLLSVHDSILWPALHQGPHGVVQRHPGGGLGHGLHAAPLGRSLGDGHTAARGQPHRGQPQGHLRPARCLFAQRCDRLEILTESLGTTVQLRHVTSQLEASARQYRLMFNEHPHPMWVYESASLRLLAVNRAMLLQYGYTEAEALQLTLLDLFPASERENVRTAVHATASESRHVPALCQQLRKDGSLFDAEVTAGSISFNGVAARQVLAVDVTERLRAEREIARMARAQKPAECLQRNPGARDV